MFPTLAIKDSKRNSGRPWRMRARQCRTRRTSALLPSARTHVRNQNGSAELYIMIKSRSPAIFVNVWERQCQVRDHFRNDCGFGCNVCATQSKQFVKMLTPNPDKTCLTAGQMERSLRSEQGSTEVDRPTRDERRDHQRSGACSASASSAPCDRRCW